MDTDFTEVTSPKPAPATFGPGPAPFPGTPEWGQMNRRRAELIDRGDQLTEAESDELALLQRDSLLALNAAFPFAAPTTFGPEPADDPLIEFIAAVYARPGNPPRRRPKPVIHPDDLEPFPLPD